MLVAQPARRYGVFGALTGDPLNDGTGRITYELLRAQPADTDAELCGQLVSVGLQENPPETGRRAGLVLEPTVAIVLIFELSEPERLLGELVVDLDVSTSQRCAVPMPLVLP